MLNSRQNAFTRWGAIAAMTVMALVVASTAVFAQATGTSTIRGTVEDTSGGVLPGATVTITNTGTRAVSTAVTDGRGGYLAVVFPGTFDIKVTGPASGIRSVALLRSDHNTHSLTAGDRYVKLAFRPKSDASRSGRTNKKAPTMTS